MKKKLIALTLLTSLLVHPAAARGNTQVDAPEPYIAGVNLAGVDRLKEWTSLGEYTITYYCACEICCGPDAQGITASGAPVREHHTVAVDPEVIPMGTRLLIGGQIYTAEDTGSGVIGRHVDIYVPDHQTAVDMGQNEMEVWRWQK